MKKVKWKKAYIVSALLEPVEIQYRDSGYKETESGEPLLYVKLNNTEYKFSESWVRRCCYSTKRAAREQILEHYQVEKASKVREIEGLETQLHIARTCLNELIQKEKEIRRALR